MKMTHPKKKPKSKTHFFYEFSLYKYLPRLFTVPYFSMSIVEFDGHTPWSLDASETGENTKCSWVVTVGLIALG